MFESFDGLPLHPLVVHAVVVLLPLAALGTIAIALRPSWRRPYGLLVLAATVAGTAMVPVATESGEKFTEFRGRPEEHADLGEQLIWFALPLLVLVIALVMLSRQAEPAQTALNVVAALSVVAAVAVSVQVYRIGEAGARATWDGSLDQRIVQPE